MEITFIMSAITTITDIYFRGRLTAAEANLRHLLFSERNFDDVLTREGVVAHFLPVSHGSEKGANISLALEAYEQMVHIGFDVVVLVACDGDYVPLVRKLNSLGARVMVIGWEYSYEDDNGGHRQTMTSGRLMAEATYGTISRTRRKTTMRTTTDFPPNAASAPWSS